MFLRPLHLFLNYLSCIQRIRPGITGYLIVQTVLVLGLMVFGHQHGLAYHASNLHWMVQIQFTYADMSL